MRLDLTVPATQAAELAVRSDVATLLARRLPSVPNHRGERCKAAHDTDRAGFHARHSLAAAGNRA
jgi:hypothetical protein